METLLPPSAATKIASYQLTGDDPSIEEAQARHRIAILNAWSVVRPGTTVLELGCGQGNCTAVLAEAVGASGRVDAVDPAPPGYGAPFTLAQAQARISESAVGPRVRWHRAEPEDFLGEEPLRPREDGPPTWDVAVLAHCVWYLASPAVLAGILRALRGRVRRVCVAEYALRAGGRQAAVPHVLAALARGTLEAHRARSSENIRTPLSPEGIVGVAASAGWKLDGEAFVVPDEGLLDGVWETGSVVGESFLREVEQSVHDERVQVVLKSSRASVLAAAEAIGGVKKTRSMDVWTGVFSFVED